MPKSAKPYRRIPLTVPKLCTICTHPKAEALDQALLTGEPVSAVAHRFGVSRDALNRHKEKHLQRLLTNSIAARNEHALDYGADLNDQVTMMRRKAESLMATAEADNDIRGAVMALREMGRLAELQAKLIGLLQAGGVQITQNTIAIGSVELDKVQAVLLDALREHPAARLAVATALAGLHGTATAPALPGPAQSLPTGRNVVDAEYVVVAPEQSVTVGEDASELYP